jgi:hypothetical protein
VTDPLSPALERARQDLEKSSIRTKLVTWAARRAQYGPETDNLCKKRSLNLAGC